MTVRSVLPIDPTLAEDVVDGTDRDLMPALAQDAGRTLRWWTVEGHASDLRPNHAQEVSSVGIGLDEDSNQMRAGGFEPGRGCFDHIRFDGKVWTFGHVAAPVAVPGHIRLNLAAFVARAA